LVNGSTREEKWYPPLWRGGLASGDVVVGGITGIEAGKETRVPNLAGPAVVQAVFMEKKCKGPRLLCEPGFEQNFAPTLRPYFRRVTDEVSELLWPAFVYNLNNDPRSEMFQFQRMWGPASALWKSKRGHPAFEHYDEFLKLLARSFLCWGDLAGCERVARENLRKWISGALAEDLVESYLGR
jgi:hypothetical protein